MREIWRKHGRALRFAAENRPQLTDIQDEYVHLLVARYPDAHFEFYPGSRAKLRVRYGFGLICSCARRRPGAGSLVASRHDPKHGKPGCYPLELGKRRILVNGQVRPGIWRPLQVSLQHGRAAVVHKLF